MKSRKGFQYLHAVFILFYVVMFSTAVFNLNLPIPHGIFGISFAIIAIIILILKSDDIRKSLKFYLTFKGGDISLNLFRLSVMFFAAHICIAIISGVAMIAGANLYKYHSMNKYIVPGLLVFHGLTNLNRHMRKKK